MLGQHATGGNDVGPPPVLVGQRTDVEVDQAEFPVLGQQRRDGHQSQRRGGRFGSDRDGRLYKIPVIGLLKERLDQQAADDIVGLGQPGGQGASRRQES